MFAKPCEHFANIANQSREYLYPPFRNWTFGAGLPDGAWGQKAFMRKGITLRDQGASASCGCAVPNAFNYALACVTGK